MQAIKELEFEELEEPLKEYLDQVRESLRLFTDVPTFVQPPYLYILLVGGGGQAPARLLALLLSSSTVLDGVPHT